MCAHGGARGAGVWLLDRTASIVLSRFMAAGVQIEGAKEVEVSSGKQPRPAALCLTLACCGADVAGVFCSGGDI